MPYLSTNTNYIGDNMTNKVYIDAVHYEKILGREMITHLKCTTILTEKAARIYSKAEMISFINQHPNCTKTKYYDALWGWREGEDVRVVDNMYLRTDSNNIKEDNLGSLPRF